MMSAQPRRLSTALIIVAAVGCGGEAASSLSGSVTFNGQPVKNGYVTFTPAESGNSFGAKIVDGQYTADKAGTGTFIAIVRAEAADAPQTREDYQSTAARPGAAVAPPPIPENAQGNGQTVEITGGGQTLDFTLTAP
jgi:hypothetical protein